MAAAMLIGAMMAAAAGQAAAPEGWVLDRGSFACEVSRSFGRGDDETFVSFTTMPLNDDLRTLLIVRDGRPGEIHRGKATLTPGASAAPRIGDAKSATVDGRRGISFATAPIAAGEAREGPLTVSTEQDGDYAMPAARLPAALAMLDRCRSDLAVAAGVDPAVQAAVAARARPATETLITSDDYPKAALKKGEQGVVRIVWQIEATGLVDRCWVVESSGSAALDEASCAVVRKRARYLPARDGAGKPVASYQAAAMNWRLPGW